MLKKLMIAASFVAMVATPALAQSYDPSVGSGNIVTSPGGRHTTAHYVPHHHRYGHRR